MALRPISLYIHIPFCSRKCPYCHFYSVADRETLKDRFLNALAIEIDRWSELLLQRQIVSIYFGGGTPFLFGPDRIGTILNRLKIFCVQDPCESTIEANPETIHTDALQQYHDLGVNRLSIGAQSFSSEHLRALGRRHSREDILRAIDQSFACGFSNISLDLMYDLPGLSVASWEATVEEACSLPIHHLSLYNLTIEPPAAWFRKKACIEATMPSEGESLAMYQAAQAIASRYGFLQYEISAFAKPEKASRHNVGYWQGREFLGFGPSAFSFLGTKRFSNVCNLMAYCQAMEHGQTAVDSIDELPPERRLREMIAVGLRMNEGVCLAALEHTWGAADPELLHTLRRLEDVGLVTHSSARLALTERGRYVYDTVAAEIV